MSQGESMDEFQNNQANDNFSPPQSDGFEPMTTLDKTCAVLAIPMDVVFMVPGTKGGY
jgi:hypothetical protein